MHFFLLSVEAKEELSLLIDETKSMANTFESSDQEVRDMVERVQQNYNANVDKINFVFEELIQVLRQRQSHLIGEVSKVGSLILFFFSLLSDFSVLF
jgi:mevalonate kinase